MKSRSRNTSCLLLLLFFAAGATAQDKHSGTQNAPADDSSVSVPVTLNGQTGSGSFASETVTESYISAGIGIVGAYSDNALLTSSNKIHNFSYMLQPHLLWSQNTPRLTWNLGASGGVLINNHLGDQNQAAESVNLGMTWRLTEHASVRVADFFSNTSGLFTSIPSPGQASGIGVVERANNTLLLPPAERVLSNQSMVEFTDQIGPHTVAGVRGSYWLLDYPSSSQSAQFGTLYNTRGYSAEAFYDWKFSARQWLGVTARGQRFETVPALLKTDVGSLLLYYSYVAGPNLTLTLFGGPEYANTTQNAQAAALGFSPGNGHLWSSSEGATLSWAANRTSANVSFARQLNDGGGLSSPVTLQVVSATLRRSLSNRGSELQFGASDSLNSPLVSNPSSASSYQGLSAFVLLQQRVAKGFVMRTGYSWQRQDVPSNGSSSSANSVWFSVSYDFVGTLGK